jgi:Tetratricopeptide repeat
MMRGLQSFLQTFQPWRLVVAASTISLVGSSGLTAFWAAVPEAEYRPALSCYLQQRYSEGVEAFEALKQTHPEDERLYYYQALCHGQLGQTDKARALYQEMVRLFPETSAGLNAQAALDLEKEPKPLVSEALPSTHNSPSLEGGEENPKAYSQGIRPDQVGLAPRAKASAGETSTGKTATASTPEPQPKAPAAATANPSPAPVMDPAMMQQMMMFSAMTSGGGGMGGGGGGNNSMSWMLPLMMQQQQAQPTGTGESAAMPAIDPGVMSQMIQQSMMGNMDFFGSKNNND